MISYFNKKVFGALIILTIFLITYILYNTSSNYNEYNVEIPEDFQLEVPSQPFYSNEPIFKLEVKHILTCAPCTNNIKTIILVTSYFGNVETRSAMRRSFDTKELEEKFKMKRVFLLAQAPFDHFTAQEAIVDESDRFNDIIQGSFMESYRNLTYKHMMGLRWAINNCKKTELIIKMDDDIVLDMRKLAGFVNGKTAFPKRFLAGYKMKNLKAQRNLANKWFVGQDEYRDDVYPTFVSGWFYMTNPYTVNLLLNASKVQKFFWIDDVLITGILAMTAHVKHIALDNYFAVHSEFLDCCIDDLIEKHLECPFMIGPNGGENNLFLKFNQLLAKCYYNTNNSMNINCKQRKKSINETCVAKKKWSIGHSQQSIITQIKLK